MSDVRLVVTCEQGHRVGEWINTIAEKYPFYCEECDTQLCAHGYGSYAWSLTAEVVEDSTKS